MKRAEGTTLNKMHKKVCAYLYFRKTGIYYQPISEIKNSDADSVVAQW
jgi:hypothetical protein